MEKSIYAEDLEALEHLAAETCRLRLQEQFWEWPISPYDLRHFENPLVIACKKGWIAGMKSLIASFDLAMIPPCFVGLHLACGKGHVDAVRLLLDEGLSVNADDSIQCTPAHWAAHASSRDDCKAGTLEVMQLLIERNADLTLVNDDDETPLSKAIREGSAEMIELLLQHMDSPLENDSGGMQLIDQCVLNNNSAAIEVIAKCFPDFVERCNCYPLHLAVLYQYPDVIKTLVRCGFSLDFLQPVAFGLDAATPLHDAVRTNSYDMVELLLELKANPNTADPVGATALHWAVKGGRLPIIRLLLEHGACTQKTAVRLVLLFFNCFH